MLEYFQLEITIQETVRSSLNRYLYAETQGEGHRDDDEEHGEGGQDEGGRSGVASVGWKGKEKEKMSFAIEKWKSQ
jgi:hypothetical protein